MFTASRISSTRHQDQDDVLAVQEDAEHAEREQDGGDRQIMGEPDCHDQPPAPVSTSTISTAIARGARILHARATWRLTPSRMLQGEHDGADHGDEQDQARDLEVDRHNSCRGSAPSAAVLLRLATPRWRRALAQRLGAPSPRRRRSPDQLDEEQDADQRRRTADIAGAAL